VIQEDLLAEVEPETTQPLPKVRSPPEPRHGDSII